RMVTVLLHCAAGDYPWEGLARNADLV
ncbi:MAG: hypothetical protein JWQ70_330, partial [Aeromicrobium sp.]|nr:hypothetical protein [Aeromicrobium sp.]